MGFLKHIGESQLKVLGFSVESTFKDIGKSSTIRKTKLVVLGDFNANLGIEAEVYTIEEFVSIHI